MKSEPTHKAQHSERRSRRRKWKLLDVGLVESKRLFVCFLPVSANARISLDI